MLLPARRLKHRYRRRGRVPSMLHLLLLEPQLLLLLLKLHSEFTFFILLPHALDVPQNTLEHTSKTPLLLFLLFVQNLKLLLARVDAPLHSSAVHEPAMHSHAQRAFVIVVVLEDAHADGVKERADADGSVKHVHRPGEVKLLLKEPAELVGP